ncbi:MAG: hypothetical protein AB7O28_16315 [Vicinamibacterales bacterium]
MDSTRISIAQLLALDVPLVWQDAVAVAQEVAMLSEVTAAMNPQAALVTAEACFLTRTGEIELPESTEHESPDAVSELLRLLLAGRDAPEALEELAFGHHGRDMSAELAVFPIGNRRAVIAKLATRALARQQEPQRPAPTPVALPPEPPPLPLGPHLVVPAPDAAGDGPRERARPVLVSPTRPEAATPRRDAAPPPPDEPLVIPPPFRAMPPFRATPAAAAAALLGEPPEVTLSNPFPAASPAGPGQPAPVSAASQVAADREVRRLRQKHAERARERGRWSVRMGAFAGRLGRLVTWRPATPDPRLIGAGVVVAAAAVTLVWTRGAVPSPPAPGAVPTGTSASAPASPPPAAATAGPTLAEAGVPSLGSALAARTTGVAGAPAGDVPPVPLPARRAPARPEPSADRGPVSRASAPESGPSAEPAHVAADPPATAARIEAPPRPSVPAPRPPVSAPPRRAEADLEAPLRRDGLLYSADDRDVTPPVMRRQQLPSALLDPAMVPPEDWPILELLIDERGTVEQVRLHARQPAPGQTLYRHRMLLAAAKAWQFEPALRNGTPVRYVMRVPLEP